MIGFEAYCRWPSTAFITPPTQNPGTVELYLLFHGTNGSAEKHWLSLSRALGKGATNKQIIQVENILWAPWSDNMFRASAHGESIAYELAQSIAQWQSLKKIHLFAASAGSYLPEPFCEAIRTVHGNKIAIVMTYLDPIGIKGSWDFSYGYRNYGACADFAEVYLNTDDSVPGTNAPAIQAFTVDVTTAPGRNEFSADGHVWPVQFYIDTLEKNNGSPVSRDHSRFPLGEVAIKGDGDK